MMSLDKVIHVAIQDGVKAFLRIGMIDDDEAITTEVVVDFINHKYQLLRVDSKAVSDCLENAKQGVEASSTRMVANGTPPINGLDGYCQWAIEKLIDYDLPDHKHAFLIGSRNSQENEVPQEVIINDVESGLGENLEAVSFYEESAFLTIKSGDIIGVWVPATSGKPGVSVQGKRLEARKGKNRNIIASNNVEFDSEKNEYRSTIDGCIAYDGKRISVGEVMEIKQHVDFSTGNIHFPGVVRVNGSIKDLFTVTADRGLNVGKHIEGADVICGGDIEIDGGVIQRDKGLVLAKGKMTAKFMDNANIRSVGDLTVVREILNSKIVCGGNVICDHGKVAGGELITGDSFYIGTLGSESGITTTLQAGRNIFNDEKIPLYEKEMRALQGQVEDINNKIAPFIPQMKRLTHEKKEALTELMFKVSEMEMEISNIEKKIEECKATSWEDCKVVVYKMIYPGVKIKIGDLHTIVHEEIQGPIKVSVSLADKALCFSPLFT